MCEIEDCDSRLSKQEGSETVNDRAGVCWISTSMGFTCLRSLGRTIRSAGRFGFPSVHFCCGKLPIPESV